MRKVLMASFDMEIGGVERSLISMLNNFDYENYKVDLMLYSHTGDFIKYLPQEAELLPENKKYASYRKSIGAIMKSGQVAIGIARLRARTNSVKIAEKLGLKEAGYVQMQLMWKYSMRLLPQIEEAYDVAISYLWPHYFVAEKVKAKKKIAWIHTDYSKLETYIEEDLRIWDKYDYIMAVSEECKNSFLLKYPSLHEKVKVMENIVSPEFINSMAEEKIEDNIFKRNNFNLISVARLSSAKGIDNGVKALKILHDKGYKNIKWYVVGYGGEEEKIRKLIYESNLEDSFFLLGKKINPYPYMKVCDLYVQPSRYEGRAVTVTEAQILGKPTLITAYPTANSQLKDGVEGVICELSVEGVADGIEILYKEMELRNKLSYNCKNTNYSNKQQLNILYDIIGE